MDFSSFHLIFDILSTLFSGIHFDAQKSGLGLAFGVNGFCLSSLI